MIESADMTALIQPNTIPVLAMPLPAIAPLLAAISRLALYPKCNAPKAPRAVTIGKPQKDRAVPGIINISPAIPAPRLTCASVFVTGVGWLEMPFEGGTGYCDMDILFSIFHRIGSHGINALVLFAYSSYPGFPFIVFSNIATPETCTSKYVMMIGEKIVHQPPVLSAIK